MSVYTKLMAARMELHGQQIKKSGRNEFAKYNYMELGDFLIPTQTIFARLGLCGIVSFTADLATLTLIDTEDGSTHVLTSPMGSAALKGCHEVQNIGAVETYQRRYLWVTAMEIVEHDALDSSKPLDTSLVPLLKASIAAEKFKKTGVMADALEHVHLTPEDREYLDDVAQNVQALFIDGGVGTAYVRLESEGLDNDQKIYLWSLLPSNVRSALKKAGEARKTKETA